MKENKNFEPSHGGLGAGGARQRSAE